MQSTDNGANFIHARIATATLLALCAFGCRQVDTLAPSNGSVSICGPQSLPAATHSTTSAQAFEVCRFPTDGPCEAPATGFNELVDENAPVHCRLTEVVCANGPSPCDEIAPIPPNFGDATKSLAEMADKSADASCGQALAEGGTADRGFKSRCGEIFAATRDDVFHDYSNFYTPRTLGEFTLILAPAAVFANSDFDADVGNWYQTHVRSAATNRASNFLRPLGNGYYTIPIYVSAKFLGEYFEDQPGMALLGEFGDRTTRALLVGGPPFLALQYLTGGGRPSVYADESYWRPFRGSHGASGHAFMGALPFLTLAGMTDDPLAKCCLYACSPWTGFTRINDNVHYLSQVWLGWWMAYLATDAVAKTEKEKGPLTMTPVCTPEMTGVGVVYQH